jgi:hypothetical protein
MDRRMIGRQTRKSTRSVCCDKGKKKAGTSDTVVVIGGQAGRARALREGRNGCECVCVCVSVSVE